MWNSNYFGYNQVPRTDSNQMFRGQIHAVENLEGTMSPSEGISESPGSSPTIGTSDFQAPTSEIVDSGIDQSGIGSSSLSRLHHGVASQNTNGCSNCSHHLDTGASRRQEALTDQNTRHNELCRSHNVISNPSQELEHNNSATSFRQGNDNTQMLLQPGFDAFNGQLGMTAMSQPSENFLYPGWQFAAPLVLPRSFQDFQVMSPGPYSAHPYSHSHAVYWAPNQNDSEDIGRSSLVPDYLHDPALTSTNGAGLLSESADHSSTVTAVGSSRLASPTKSAAKAKHIFKDIAAEQQADVPPFDERSANDQGQSPSAYGDDYESELSEDAEEISVRKDPLYNAEVGDDGLYHCPYAEEGCAHAPTKLKCNYDKYIDSHLKPHRCKASECKDLRFSSTACRLRHEREAHGSYGHGVRPYLCKYQDCERSKPGMGFPRSWNCNDHMKRVHGRPNSPSVEAGNSPGDSAKGNGKPPIGKKRKGQDAESQPSGKKQKATGPKRDETDASNAPARKSQKDLLNQQWRHQYMIVHRRVHALTSATDTAAVEQLYKDAGLLSAMSKRLAEFA